MGIERQFDDELNRIEQELAQLRPRDGRLDQGRLMFLAGRESAASDAPRRKSSVWIWPAATSLMTVAAAVFAALWLMPRDPLVVEKIVYVKRPVESKSIDNDSIEQVVKTNQVDDEPHATGEWHPEKRDAIPQPHYFRARQIALTQGIDHLPTVGYGGSGVDAPTSYRELFNSLIGRQIDVDEHAPNDQPSSNSTDL